MQFIYFAVVQLIFQDITTEYKFKTVVDLGSGPGYNLEGLQDRDIETLYQVGMLLIS